MLRVAAACSYSFLNPAFRELDKPAAVVEATERQNGESPVEWTREAVFFAIVFAATAHILNRAIGKEYELCPLKTCGRVR